ncbi:NAD(P)H-binding protein [Lentilactobacillus senioris]|uniref:NAD(P)H-binding protein n=1 Tax=Lentilactobacillus senioris TaxID=931534 RepID=UPI002280EFB1|nr:NAD(P)H-binding protein [Lentilactobacillus senioris]MCY9806176.1 NAD(P)H-binding protein [Lentilactobacillus senioris]
MKIFVVGASGRVGQQLTDILVANGHEVYAGARHPKSTNQNVHPVEFDMHADLASLTPKLAGMDAVYFVAGSRGADLLQTDAFGAVKVAQAAMNNQIDRFILLSSLFATEPARWAGIPGLASLTDYNIAKYFADKWVIDNFTGDYTILQPGTLQDVAGTGTAAINVTDGGDNPIPDVAAVLAEMLNQASTYRKVVTMHSGDTKIENLF